MMDYCTFDAVFLIFEVDRDRIRLEQVFERQSVA
jgi:hypothetical protein